MYNNSMKIQRTIMNSVAIISLLTGLGIVSSSFMPSYADASVSGCSDSLVMNSSDGGPASASCNVTINATVISSVGISSMVFTQNGLANVVPGGSVSTGSLSIETFSNTPYYVNLATVNGAYSGKTYTQAPALELESDSSKTIPAGSPASSSSAWGVKINGTSSGNKVYSCNNTYCALKKLTSTTDPTSQSDATSIGYTEFYRTTTSNPGAENHNFTIGASASASQTAGTYRGVIKALAISNV